MTATKYTTEQAAKMFGVSVDRIKEQYAENAKQLEVMYQKAITTGKKVNGYTADQLSEMVADFKNRAK